MSNKSVNRYTAYFKIGGKEISVEIQRTQGDPAEFEEHIKTALEKNFSFYKSIPSTVEHIMVQFLYTRSEYDELVGRPTGAWAGGYSTTSYLYL